MDKAIEKITQIGSPEALQAFYSWLTYRYIHLGFKIFLGLLVIGIVSVLARYLYRLAKEE